MRYITALLFLSSMATTILSAQHEFAPIGAKWYVNSDLLELGAGGYLEDFYLIESTGDTVIGNVTYRQVGDYLLYQDGEQVSYLLNDTLHLIYDFGVEVGDTVAFDMLGCYYPSDQEWKTLTFKVVEVTQEDVQGTSLKKIRCEGVEGYLDEYIYMERVGAQRVLIEDHVGCVFIGTYIEEWLRCYEDEDILYKTPIFLFHEGEDCDYRYITSTEEKQELIRLSIIPNPTTDYWLLDWDYSEKAQLHLLDIQGNLIRTQAITPGQQKIPAQDLPSGVYLMKVKGDSVWGSVRVVKQ